MNRQIFFDPQRKRWKRLRRILDAVAVVSTVILVLFFLNVVKRQQLPELLLPTPKRNYRALQAAAEIRANYLKAARRKTSRKPSEIPFNSGESLRAAYYVDDDPGSYASLKSHIHQIDMLFPGWLYVPRPEGTLQGAPAAQSPVRVYNVVDAHGVHGVDPQNKVRDLIAAIARGYGNLSPAHQLQRDDPGVGSQCGRHAEESGGRGQPGAPAGQIPRRQPELPRHQPRSGRSPDDALPGYHALIGELYTRCTPRICASMSTRA